MRNSEQTIDALDAQLSQTVSEVIGTILAAETTEVFGLMGNGNAYLIDALVKHGVNYTSLRHEAGAVSAADAYHRVSTRLGVATVTYGAGFTNTLTALQEAQMAATPMILVTGDEPLGGARPWDTNQIALAEALGVTTFRIHDAQATATTTRAAIAEAYSSLQPVVLSIPFDLAVSNTHSSPRLKEEAEIPQTQSRSGHQLDQALIHKASHLLSIAERPLIIAGRGARLADVSLELHQLAKNVGALTATTLLAQGLFKESKTDLGVAGGFGRAWALQYMAQADVVLVVGARLNQFTLHMGSLLSDQAKVIQVDVSEKSAHARADLFIRGDAKNITEKLEQATRDFVHHQGWRDTFMPDRDARYPDDSAVPEHQPDGKLDPRAVASALDRVLPTDRILVHDLGNFVEWMHTRTHLPGPGRCVMSGSAFQSIGLGLSGVLGAAKAAPDSTAVLATGDGGMLMALADLESVVRGTRSCIIVVFNDAAYGAEVHQYANYGLPAGPMLIEDVNFAELARAVGAQGQSVREIKDLDVVREWRERGAQGTLVLDCKVSPQVVSPVLDTIAQKIQRPVDRQTFGVDQ